MTIWAIEEGEYSDYRVGPFFATRELAEAYVEHYVRRGRYHYQWHADDCDCATYVREEGEAFEAFLERMTRAEYWPGLAVVEQELWDMLPVVEA